MKKNTIDQSVSVHEANHFEILVRPLRGFTCYRTETGRELSTEIVSLILRMEK